MNPVQSQSQPGIEAYDLVILGSGEGSKYLAWTLAKQAQRVAVVERKYIGGSCPNIACLPSKNIIHSAKVASYFRRSEEFGIQKTGFTIDMSAVRARKRNMVTGLIDVHVGNYKKSGAELILGAGKFIGPRTIEVALNEGGVRRLQGTNVVIGTGTRATLDPIPGLAEAQPLTHIEFLELDEIPGHLLVLGGGYIGLELAQAMRRFGSQVTIIERNSRLVHREDEDVTEGLHSQLTDEGIELVLGATTSSVSGKSGQAVEVVIEQSGSRKALKGTHLLVATGRTPNTEGLGVEAAGIELTERGYVKTNARLETTAPGVWAVGESAGSPQFTHIAFDDFRVIRDNLAGGNHVTTGRQVPFCLFTDPEFARIGLSETEAREQGISYRLFKIPISAVLRTRTLSETRGFLKALVEGGSDRILGFTAFGVDAGEIMASVQIAMLAGLPYTGLRDAVLTHPTLLEGLVVLFMSMPVERHSHMHKVADTIPGYTFDSTEVPPSSVTEQEFALLKTSVGFTDEDQRYLRLAGEVLRDQAHAVVLHWRGGIIANIPNLARHSKSPDGAPNPDYLAKSNLRFEQWILDTCFRPYDRDWLNYQQEIALRHTSLKKNQTDGVASTSHVPLRDVIGFVAVMNETIKPYLAANGQLPEEVERMHLAWCKSMQLQIALWSRPYTDPQLAANEW